MISRVSIGVMCAIFVTPVLGANLLLHADFDAPADLDVWTVMGNGSPTASWDSGEDAQGNTITPGSALVGITGLPGAGGGIESMCVPAGSGKYIATSWMKTPIGAEGGGPNDSIGLLVTSFSDSHCIAATGGYGNSYSSIHPWTQYRTIVDLPPGTKGATVLVSILKGPANAGALKMWIDGVTLEADVIFAGGFDGAPP